MADPIPGLGPIAGLGRGAPTDRTIKPPGEGVKITSVRTAEGVVLPALIALGSIPAGPESAIARKAIHLTTGFKLPPLGGEPTPTPFAALFLLPQPIGMLPERFFQSKPQVPGTGIYFDPLHQLDQQATRIGDDRREAARLAQTRALTRLLPDLTEDQLRGLLQDRDLQQRTLTFIEPLRREELIRTELRAAVAARTTQEGVASFAAERAVELLRGAPLAAILEEQALLRGQRPRDSDSPVVLVIGVGPPARRASPLDPFGVPIAAGSLQPAAIKPVNAAALANEAAARGIRRQLVSERADP